MNAMRLEQRWSGPAADHWNRDAMTFEALNRACNRLIELLQRSPVSIAQVLDVPWIERSDIKPQPRQTTKVLHECEKGDSPSAPNPMETGIELRKNADRDPAP